MSDTDFKAVPMQLEEARYSYRNSQQISSQTGLIGYLRRQRVLVNLERLSQRFENRRFQERV